MKSGFFGARFFTFQSYAHRKEFELYENHFKATIRAPGWGGVVVTRVDLPSASCEFDSRLRLRSIHEMTLN